jgi:hypothetical protein
MTRPYLRPLLISYDLSTMSSRLWILLDLLTFLIIGFIRTMRTVSRLLREREEVDRFSETFKRYSDSRGGDLQAYGQLIERSDRVQKLLGYVGVMARYITPFERIVIPNYHIILNALPAMRQDYERGNTRTEYAPIIGETLVRYLGVSSDLIRQKQTELQNPMVWFREGIGGMLLLPVLLFQSLGLTSDSSTASVASSAAFRIVTGVLTLVSLVGSIITIVLGWRQSVAVLRQLFGR